MNVFSLPIYVNDTHLCVVVLVSLTNVVVGRLRLGGLCVCVWTGNPLLDRMSWMMNTKKKKKKKKKKKPSTTSYLIMGFLSTHTHHQGHQHKPQEEILMSTLQFGNTFLLVIYSILQ